LEKVLSHFATLDQDARVEKANVPEPGQDSSPSRAQERGDRAMPADGQAWESKERNGDGWLPHQIRIDVKAHHWTSDVLSDAIRRGQYIPQFQAKVSFSTGAVVGAHVLPAWEHPELGLLSAPFFMDDMASFGMVQDLMESVLTQALTHLRSWGSEHLLTLTIGLPVCLLEHPMVAHRLAGLARSFQVDCNRLSVIVTDAPYGPVSRKLMDALVQLKGYGFGLVLGDIATGLFSLRMLQEFTFDEINLGQALTSTMRADTRSLVIADAVINLCKQLGIKIIAEGIETSGECAILRAAGCDFGLGRHFSQPASADHFHQGRMHTHFCDDASCI
jgi:EAL domain-containing protein (putative c-di-GMP-specific phosphodiesterase class I)